MVQIVVFLPDVKYAACPLSSQKLIDWCLRAGHPEGGPLFGCPVIGISRAREKQFRSAYLFRRAFNIDGKLSNVLDSKAVIRKMLAKLYRLYNSASFLTIGAVPDAVWRAPSCKKQAMTDGMDCKQDETGQPI